MRKQAVIRLERNIKLSEAYNSAGCSIGVELHCPQTPVDIKKTIKRAWSIIDEELVKQGPEIRGILKMAARITQA